MTLDLTLAPVGGHENEGAAPLHEAAPTDCNHCESTMLVDAGQPSEMVSSNAKKGSKIAREHHKVLLDRAIPVAFAEAHGIQSVDLAKVAQFQARYKMCKLDIFPDLPLHKITGLMIPYPASVDAVARFRVRSDVTSYVKPGPIEGSHHGETEVSVPRYICQKGVSVVPYMIDEVLQAAKTPSVPLFVVEAPLKALSLTANGFTAIGLGGVIAGAHDSAVAKEYGDVVACADMRRVDWAGRTTYISYDAGLNDNPMVALGMAYAWRSLRDLGADVKVVRLPYHQPPADKPEWFNAHDQGPDDYIAKFGVDAYRKLADAAHPADPVARARAVLEGKSTKAKAKARAEKLALLTELFRDLAFGACLRVGGEATVAGVLLVGKSFGLTKTAINEVVEEFNERLSRRLARDDPDWMSKLHVTKAGVPRPIRENVEVALRHDQGLAAMLAFNELSQEIVFAQEPPWVEQYPAASATKVGDPWSDVDDVRLAGYLSAKAGLIDLPEGKVKAACIVVSRERTVNPVADYLNGLEWDQIPRCGSWLPEYFGVEGDEYTRNVGRWWLISAVARALDPGCKVDHVLVLEGDQGIAKSSALGVLGGDYFSDADLGDLRSKEAAMALQGVWLMELAEGEIFSRASARALKAFVSKRFDDLIPKFSNRRARLQRRCVFSLTTNDRADYLSDSTGNRRFWPVECKTVDLDGLRQDRDQLWAEAVTLYKAGEAWWPKTDAERKLCTTEQSHRMVQDPWVEKVAAGIGGLGTVTIAYVLTEVLELKVDKQGRRDQLRAADCLRSLGWVEGSRTSSARTWVRGPGAGAKAGDGPFDGASEGPPSGQRHLRVVPSPTSPAAVTDGAVVSVGRAAGAWPDYLDDV